MNSVQLAAPAGHSPVQPVAGWTIPKGERVIGQSGVAEAEPILNQPKPPGWLGICRYSQVCSPGALK